MSTGKYQPVPPFGTNQICPLVGGSIASSVFRGSLFGHVCWAHLIGIVACFGLLEGSAISINLGGPDPLEGPFRCSGHLKRPQASKHLKL